MRPDPLNAETAAATLRRRLTRADVMTARDVADLLDLPVSTVYEFARRGVLPCARLGRTVRFVRDEIERTLQPAGDGGDEGPPSVSPAARPGRSPLDRQPRTRR